MIQGNTKEQLFKSPYEWCLYYNVRPYEPENWGRASNEFSFGHFHESNIKEADFLDRLKDVKHKENSRPRKMDEFLELRMYGLVIYQLTGIQTGIQFQHAVTEYQRYLGTTTDDLGCRLEIGNRYGLWADKWKTSILLNGGTTNDSEQYVGSKQKYLAELRDNGVHVQTFREPDLGNVLTAMCFIVDERVFDTESYPSFEPTPKPYAPNYTPNTKTIKAWEDDNARNYNKWVEKIGGESNAFLREFTSPRNLKLATN